MAATGFSSLPHVFSRAAIRQERSHQREVDNLKSKLSQKDEVIADLLTEHIALKKKTGVKNILQFLPALAGHQLSRSTLCCFQ